MSNGVRANLHSLSRNQQQCRPPSGDSSALAWTEDEDAPVIEAAAEGPSSAMNRPAIMSRVTVRRRVIVDLPWV